MSAAELTANGGRMSPDVAKRVDEAIEQALEAQRLVAALQQRFLPGGDMTVDAMGIWHRLETIDDRLHEALSKLGN